MKLALLLCWLVPAPPVQFAAMFQALWSARKKAA